MRCYNQNYYFKFSFICCLLFSMLAVSQVYAAGKGHAGTPVRAAWCKAKYNKCVEDAESDCDDLGGVKRSECLSSEVITCKNAYGSTSDCYTRDLVGRNSNKPRAVGGQKVYRAPVSRTGIKGKIRDHRRPRRPTTSTIIAPNN